MSVQRDETGPSTFGGMILETAGVKGIVLVLYLVAVTAAGSMYGVSFVEGVLPGGLLVALLALGLLTEVSLLRRPIDHIGVLVMVIALAYTAIEYLAVYEGVLVKQGVWFPMAAAAVLLGAVTVDAVRNRSGPGFDVVDMMGNVDIVGLYGGMLLIVYGLLVQGGQIDFLYTPYFPAFALAFAVSILLTSAAYISRAAAEADDGGQLHRRLVSVIGSLTDVEDDEEKREIAQHVRAVAGALNGIEIPSEVEDDEGRVPLVLPVSHNQIAFRSSSLDDALDRAAEAEMVGFVADVDQNVIFVAGGEPVRFYHQATERYDDEIGRLRETAAFKDDVRGYMAGSALVDDVLDVTPEPSGAADLLEETEAEIERRLGEPDRGSDDGGSETMAAGSSGESDVQPTEEQYDITDIEDVEETQGAGDGVDLDVGGRDIDLEEMLEEANKVFDEDTPY